MFCWDVNEFLEKDVSVTDVENPSFSEYEESIPITSFNIEGQPRRPEYDGVIPTATLSIINEIGKNGYEKSKNDKFKKDAIYSEENKKQDNGE